MNFQSYDLAFEIFGLLWVGGGGLLMYRHPTWCAKVNERFGFRRGMTPGFQKFIKALGIVEMVLAALGAISVVSMTVLGVH
ncbi:hypothetical protein P8935_20240 [Telmatobacter sp. DSM 110680]|uniref:Copper resistance protein D n=1 Tax=Telmatobacter sp. DSM 110680 TaxID=3036704 RepID=A0AAU7DIH9_9BACT